LELLNDILCTPDQQPLLLPAATQAVGICVSNTSKIAMTTYLVLLLNLLLLFLLLSKFL
jgi:hypothetical protein